MMNQEFEDEDEYATAEYRPGSIRIIQSGGGAGWPEKLGLVAVALWGVSALLLGSWDIVHFLWSHALRVLR